MDNQSVTNKKDLSQITIQKDLFAVKNKIYPF